MSIKEFIGRGERSGPRTESAAVKLTAAAPPRTISPSTSIDADTVLEGTLRCKETLRIDGRIKGTVECEKSVFIGECAKVKASITADEVQVSGVARGNITARRKITLKRTAVVIGDLTTPGIVIEEGAKVEGRIVIGSDAVRVLNAKPAPETTKSPARKKAATQAKSDELPVAAAPA